MHILYRNGFTFYTATYNYVCERRCEAALSKVMAAWFNGYERLPVVYSGDDSVYIVLSHNKYGLFHVKVIAPPQISNKTLHIHLIQP